MKKPIITFDEFKKLGNEAKAVYVMLHKDIATSALTPFWLERLITGLTNGNRLVASCTNELIEIYDDIKEHFHELNNINAKNNKTYIDTLLKEVKNELDRAKKIHPKYPINTFEQVSILNEKIGAVTKAVNDYKANENTLYHIKEELIQAAAMCIRMITNLK